MKKVFLDTNIHIDYLARRGQFFEPAAKMVQLGQQHHYIRDSIDDKGCLTALPLP